MATSGGLLEFCCVDCSCCDFRRFVDSISIARPSKSGVLLSVLCAEKDAQRFDEPIQSENSNFAENRCCVHDSRSSCWESSSHPKIR